PRRGGDRAPRAATNAARWSTGSTSGRDGRRRRAAHDELDRQLDLARGTAGEHLLQEPVGRLAPLRERLAPGGGGGRVGSGGGARAASGMSSNPATETSSGTRRPASATARVTPSASRSL